MNEVCRPHIHRRCFLAAVLGLALWSAPAPAAQLGSDQPVQFWFVRHGESELNVSTLPHPVPDDGVTYPLTRDGTRQVLALAESLAAAPITTIYTSTRLRAIQTADAIAFRHGLNITLAPEAVEMDLGIPLDAADGRQQYVDLLNRWLVDGDTAARIGTGESFLDAQRRFLPFVRELMNRHSHDTGVVVIVSHGATLGLFVPVLAPNVPADYMLTHPLSNASVIKTELRDGRLYCIEWAGVRQAPASP